MRAACLPAFASAAVEQTAAIIVIGNEILSGKVVDTNSPYLARELRALGVDLRRVVVIPDEVEVIAEVVRELAPKVDYVFTSGGVGPTHDDVTMEGVAQGLGRHVVRHPALERFWRDYFGREAQSALKMAEVPEGGELLLGEGITVPVVKVANVYVLPGIPEFFRGDFEAIRERFRLAPFHLRRVYLRSSEGAIAAKLHELLAAYPDLLLGSYPTVSDPAYDVLVTLESKDAACVEEALKSLLALLPPQAVLRWE